GWEYAELLRAAGVRTVNELRYRNPQKLADAMAVVNTKRKLVRILPSVNTVTRWTEDAKKLPPLIRYCLPRSGARRRCGASLSNDRRLDPIRGPAQTHPNRPATPCPDI